MQNTTQDMVKRALCDGDTPEMLECFYQPIPDDPAYDGWSDNTAALVACTFNELPTRQFDSGYGGIEGEPVICFSPRYVYIQGTYDGSEWVQAIPRHPAHIAAIGIPRVGGG